MRRKDSQKTAAGSPLAKSGDEKNTDFLDNKKGPD